MPEREVEPMSWERANRLWNTKPQHEVISWETRSALALARQERVRAEKAEAEAKSYKTNMDILRANARVDAHERAHAEAEAAAMREAKQQIFVEWARLKDKSTVLAKGMDNREIEFYGTFKVHGRLIERVNAALTALDSFCGSALLERLRAAEAVCERAEFFTGEIRDMIPSPHLSEFLPDRVTWESWILANEKAIAEWKSCGVK